MSLNLNNDKIHFEVTTLAGKEMWYEHFDFERMSFANKRSVLSYTNMKSSREGSNQPGTQAIDTLDRVGVLDSIRDWESVYQPNSLRVIYDLFPMSQSFPYIEIFPTNEERRIRLLQYKPKNDIMPKQISAGEEAIGLSFPILSVAVLFESHKERSSKYHGRDLTAPLLEKPVPNNSIK